MDNKYCNKCKTALIKCPDCYNSGKKNGMICTNCKGSGYICQMHGGDNGLPQKS
jgi:hypothetical protein